MRINEVINPNVILPNFHSEKIIDSAAGELKLTATNLNGGRVPQFVVTVETEKGQVIGNFRFVVVDYEPEKKVFGFKVKSKLDP